ncbi:ribosomal RNA small subunit methyltransferase A [bacterium]|nr:ribosomal RNA small subunit methyltransferase A [bacterium]
MGLKKSLGQNFIFDNNYIRSLVKLGDIKNKNFMEIGLGNGNLTEVLLEQADQIQGVEIDKKWCEKLSKKFANNSKLILHCENFLKLDLDQFHGKKYTFFSNIPYNLSSKILARLMDYHFLFDEYFMLVQYEFAKRLFSPEGSKTYGSLSVFFQLHFSGKILKKVPPSVFTPPPKVDSAFIQFHNDIKYDVPKAFFTFVKLLFSNRRKTITKSLGMNYNYFTKNDIIKKLNEVNINERSRVEEIDMERLVNLYISFFPDK